MGNGDDSENEEQPEPDRSHKNIPEWSVSRVYLQSLNEQADLDPDTIFGSRVPGCVLEDIFTDDIYRSANKSRPRRRRGSSGDWRRDRLNADEIKGYKQKMGHV